MQISQTKQLPGVGAGLRVSMAAPCKCALLSLRGTRVMADELAELASRCRVARSALRTGPSKALAAVMHEFFDDDFPPGERIPRHLEVTLRAVPGPFGETVRMTVNGLPVGNPLTDNARSETGYRWHDTLHLAHAVCLGWSPVLRSLAGLKRRSDALADHVEDGGRAIVADESIAWAVFCNARKHGW